jgi:Protein of unknown function (DUF3570)
MQLRKRNAAQRKPRRQIGGSVAAATCALLGPAATHTVVAQELQPWTFDSAVLYYGEADGRVQDLSVSALLSKELREDSLLTATMTVDALTGATPNGAAPSTSPQTFTRPSGRDSYTVGAGATPLDDSFQDTRWAFSASYAWPLARLSKLSVGGSVSAEYDYTHVGVNANIARDFNNRNTTLSFGVALANDTISPVGGTPTALSPMLPANIRGEDGGFKGPDQSKDVLDLLVGVTQVLNRHSLVQFNYSLTRSDGYMNDPYKILSVVDSVNGLPVAGPPGSGLSRYLYESRPDTREKQSLFGLYKRDFDGNVFDVSYRYMTDDWDIKSHTIDMHYRFRLGDSGKYLQPHLRFYSQTAANFYSTVLFDAVPVPLFASADYRLGEFDAVTLGLKYGQPTRSGEIDARLELYRQSGTPSPGSAVGALTNLDLYPDLNAVIAQFSYKFGR